MSAVGLLLSATLVAGARWPMPRRPHLDVITTQGVVRGYNVESPPHHEFFGIPYGAPPSEQGDRFKVPKVAPRWDGIFEARHRIKCPQPDGAGEENCLVVNVFAPEGSIMAPVLMHFHQGGFHSGWGSFEPPTRFLKQGFVVVTFNYRLGALGFLCLGVAEAPGNMGLKDQVAALYWVHRNIERFGGNPAEVTLYGTGAGAASVQFLILTISKRNLFHKAIIESGSALAPFSIAENPAQTALNVAQTLGYSNYERDVTYLARFFIKLSTDSLVNHSVNFKPCVEKGTIFNSLLDADPLSILKNSLNKDIPIMFVYTDQEVVSMIGEVPPNWQREPRATDFKDLMPSNLMFDSDKLKNNIADTAINLYFRDGNHIKGYIDFFTDTYIAYPMAKSASLHALRSVQPVFFMKFSYDGNLNANKVVPLEGAVHGDVFKYIFSTEDFLNNDDEEVASKLIKMWTNFMKYSDPTPLTSTMLPEIWPRVLDLNKDNTLSFAFNQYLDLKRDKSMQKKTMGITLQFWDKIYMNYHKAHVTNNDDYTL